MVTKESSSRRPRRGRNSSTPGPTCFKKDKNGDPVWPKPLNIEFGRAVARWHRLLNDDKEEANKTTQNAKIAEYFTAATGLPRNAAQVASHLQQCRRWYGPENTKAEDACFFGKDHHDSMPEVDSDTDDGLDIEASPSDFAEDDSEPRFSLSPPALHHSPSPPSNTQYGHPDSLRLSFPGLCNVEHELATPLTPQPSAEPLHPAYPAFPGYTEPQPVNISALPAQPEYYPRPVRLAACSLPPKEQELVPSRQIQYFVENSLCTDYDGEIIPAGDSVAAFPSVYPGQLQDLAHSPLTVAPPHPYGPPYTQLAPCYGSYQSHLMEQPQLWCSYT